MKNIKLVSVFFVAIACATHSQLIYGFDDGHSLITREEVTACLSEVKDLHASVYPWIRKKNDQTWAEWGDLKRYPHKRSIHQSHRDHVLAAEHDVYRFMLPDLDKDGGSVYKPFYIAKTRRLLNIYIKNYNEDLANNDPRHVDYRPVYRVELCISQARLAKLDGKPLAVVRPRPSAGDAVPAVNSRAVNREQGQNQTQAQNPAPATGSSRSVLSSEQTASCSEEIKSKQVESQSWGGDVNAVANRLGRFQKDLFEGRCAGHPEAQAYLAGANKMLSYKVTAPASNNQLNAQQQPARKNDKREKRLNAPEAHAHHCLTTRNTGEFMGYGGFVNKCNFMVEYEYCAYRPKKDSWAEAFDCEKGKKGAWQIPAHGTDAAHVRNAEKIHWFACKWGASFNQADGISPRDVKFVGDRLVGRCAEW